MSPVAVTYNSNSDNQKLCDDLSLLFRIVSQKENCWHFTKKQNQMSSFPRIHFPARREIHDGGTRRICFLSQSAGWRLGGRFAGGLL